MRNKQTAAIIILAAIVLLAVFNMGGGAGFWTELLYNLIYAIPALLITMTIHEMAHGYMAYWMGDYTARAEGRLSLNPLRHLDIFGTLMILFVGFGWAKPVPINMRNFKHEKLGLVLVSLAGPLVNILLGTICYFAFYLMPQVPYLTGFLAYLSQLNILIAIFNLIPIPPLDGSKILTAFLPYKQKMFVLRYEQLGMILLLFLSFSGITSRIISPIASAYLGLLSNFIS